MKGNMKRLISAILVLAMALTLTACGGPKETGEKTDGNAPKNEGKPDEVQELNLVLADLKLLDVNDVRNENEFQILSHVQEGLFRVMADKDGKETVTNAGCESYKVSDDGLVYTFKIRDYEWSDGVKVTAQQYVDSIIRLLNPDMAFPYTFLAFDIKNAHAFYKGTAKAEDVGAKAIDEKTLEITLEAAIPFFAKKLTNVCFFPVRLDVIAAAGDAYAKDFTKQVYSGPFIIESRILENEIVLVKNEKYWDAKNVKLNKVKCTVVPEPATQSLLLDSKELDAVVSKTEYSNKWKAKADKGELVHFPKITPSVWFMCFNQHTGGPSKLMNNAKIRKALSLALDRDEFNSLVYDGMNTPAYGLIPFGLMVGDKEYRSVAKEPIEAEAKEYNNNNEKLQALFKEGMKEEGLTKELADVELIFLGDGTTNLNKAEQEFFKQQWEEKLGIKINVSVSADASLHVVERNANRYDMIYGNWSGDYSDPMTFMELFTMGSGYAKYMGGYHNEEFDKMFSELKTEIDPAKRQETYIKMEKNIVDENAGIAPLFYSSKQIFIQPYVKGVFLPTFGAPFEFSRAYISGKN